MTIPLLSPDHLVTADGQSLPLRHWFPAGHPHAVILAIHGFNDYSNAFAEPGKAWAEAGMVVYAYDQRGFGAGPNPGYWPGWKALADDLDQVIRLVVARHPGVPLYLVGESMGGAVAMATLSRPSAPHVAGVVLSAPAVWGRETMPLYQRAALWLSFQLMPGVTLSGNGLHIKPSDNVEMLRAMSHDPLVIKDTRVDTIHGLADLMDHALSCADRFETPALVLYGERDEVVPRAPTFAMMRRLPDRNGRQRLALYANGYHMLLRDTQAAVVLHDIATWIADPSAPLPSGADQRAKERVW